MTGPIDFDKLVLGPCHDKFSVVANYRTVNDQFFDITVIFDKAYTRIVIISGEAVTETMPVAGCRTSEFPFPPQQSDFLTINGDRYTVREAQFDGRGAVKLLLNGPLT